MSDINEAKFRCSKMMEMFRSDAWEFFKAEYALEVSKVTERGRKAVAEGKTEAAAYAMAELTALDRFFMVEEGLRRKFNEYLNSEKEQKQEFENA